MLQDIKDYRPDQINFVLTDETKEKFAEVLTLFEGADDVEKVIEKVNEYFGSRVGRWFVERLVKG